MDEMKTKSVKKLLFFFQFEYKFHNKEVDYSCSMYKQKNEIDVNSDDEID